MSGLCKVEMSGFMVAPCDLKADDLSAAQTEETQMGGKPGKAIVFLRSS
jgi:hypothetical protein